MSSWRHVSNISCVQATMLPTKYVLSNSSRSAPAGNVLRPAARGGLGVLETALDLGSGRSLPA